MIINKCLVTLEKFLDLHFRKYGQVLMLGDFNVGVNEQHIQACCETNNLKSLMKQDTCIYLNLTCIDLTLANVPRSF